MSRHNAQDMKLFKDYMLSLVIPVFRLEMTQPSFVERSLLELTLAPQSRCYDVILQKLKKLSRPTLETICKADSSTAQQLYQLLLQVEKFQNDHPHVCAYLIAESEILKHIRDTIVEFQNMKKDGSIHYLWPDYIVNFEQHHLERQQLLQFHGLNKTLHMLREMKHCLDDKNYAIEHLPHGYYRYQHTQPYSNTHRDCIFKDPTTTSCEQSYDSDYGSSNSLTAGNT